jgi:hypothetical protein
MAGGNTMIANSIKETTGCNCGSRSVLPLQPCSCGGGGSATCKGQGFIRPLFFAGQLLTEDDLQLLTDYVGQKNRLHNRYLFGAGVVCGLEVTCHPCGDGQVIVHPGYALDCCGNDLVFACAKTLDINAMIRDLRRDQLGGFDCVEPCPPAPKECKDQAGNTSANPQPDETQDTPTQTPKIPARKYCLYIRYCEQKSDPIMPYSTGDDCGALVCESSRVHEGVRFELRCPPTVEVGNPLLKRLCECLGDLNTAIRAIYASRQLQVYTASLRSALQSISDSAPLQPVTVTELKEQTETLNIEKGKLEGSMPSTPEAAATRPPPEPGTFGSPFPSGFATSWRERLYSAAAMDIAPAFRDAAVKLAQTVTRVQMLDPQARDAFRDELKSAQDAFKASELVGKRILNIIPETPENAEFLAALEISTGELRADDISVQLLARGAVFHSMTVKAYAPLAELARNWLLDRLDQSPFLTDCTLRQQAEKMEMPEVREQISIRDARSFANTNTLAELVINYIRDCICRALNPACAPCDDSAVLLACLEVDECNVVRICNLERSFVLSPAAVQYWLPPLQLIGNVLEKLCCMPIEKLVTEESGRTMNSFFKKMLGEEATRLLRASFCSTDDRQIASAFSQILDAPTSPRGLHGLGNVFTASSVPMDDLMAQLEPKIEVAAEKKIQEIMARKPESTKPKVTRKKPAKPPSEAPQREGDES